MDKSPSYITSLRASGTIKKQMWGVTEYLLKVFVRCYVSSNYYGNITNYPNSSTSAFGKLSEWTVCFTEKHLSLKTPCKNRLINYRELCHSVPINVQGIRLGMRLGISETLLSAEPEEKQARKTSFFTRAAFKVQVRIHMLQNL